LENLLKHEKNEQKANTGGPIWNCLGSCFITDSKDLHEKNIQFLKTFSKNIEEMLKKEYPHSVISKRPY